MENLSIEEQISNIQKKIIKTQILGFPGAIFVGLALYAIFAANGDAFHPLLNDMNIVYSILAIGLIIELWQMISVISLFKQRAELTQSTDSITRY